MIKKICLVAFATLSVSLILLFTYVPSKDSHHGRLDLQLYVGDAPNQPLIVGFGGGEGGNAWTSNRWKPIRDQFIENGYSFLAIGYFGAKNTQPYLDRISLNAIYDSIQRIATHPLIDESNIGLIGGSKGGELVLNLASRYSDFKTVVAIVPSHISFPALTLTANTSSWEYDGEEVPYAEAPFKIILPALIGDHHTAFSMMLEDQDEVKKAIIKVEKINGSILLLSASEDEMWPSTDMSDEIMKRLKEKQFKHTFEHLIVEGGHSEPLDHFDHIFDFLENNFK